MDEGCVRIFSVISRPYDGVTKVGQMGRTRREAS